MCVNWYDTIRQCVVEFVIILRVRKIADLAHQLIYYYNKDQ